MKLRLSILLLAAALAASPAAGQTIKSLGYNTTNGFVTYSGTNSLTFTNALQFATNARAATRTNLGGTTVGDAVFTATNAAAAATAVGLGTTNDVNFNRVQVGGATVTTGGFSDGNFEVTPGHAITFVSGASPAPTRTNLGLGATWLTNTDVSNFRTAIGLGATNNVTFSNITASGTLDVTGNVTMSGVNNTMPGATNAASASSLMTRDLVDQAYVATPNALTLGAIAGATNGTSASVIIGFNMAGDARLRPGGSTNGYASAYFVKNISGGASAISSSRINFAQRIDVSGQLRITTATNVDTKVRFIVGANASSAVPASADALAFSNAGFGFEIDSLTNSLIKRVRLIYHDGSTNRQSEYHNFATNDALNNVIMSYRVVSQAGNIQLYFLASATLEGALPLLSGPVISVTNGPATTNSLDHSAILVSAAQDSVAYTNHATALFSPIKLRQN